MEMNQRTSVTCGCFLKAADTGAAPGPSICSSAPPHSPHTQDKDGGKSLWLQLGHGTACVSPSPGASGAEGWAGGTPWLFQSCCDGVKTSRIPLPRLWKIPQAGGSEGGAGAESRGPLWSSQPGHASRGTNCIWNNFAFQRGS